VDIGDASLGKTLFLEVSHDPVNHRRFSNTLTEGGAVALKYQMPAWTFDELLIAKPVSNTFSMADVIFLFIVFGEGV